MTKPYCPHCLNDDPKMIEKIGAVWYCAVCAKTWKEPAATFTDRFGQEYIILFSGRQELLPPRASKSHPLNSLGWGRSELSGCNREQIARSKVYRERQARERAEVARLLDGGRA